MPLPLPASTVTEVPSSAATEAISLPAHVSGEGLTVFVAIRTRSVTAYTAGWTQLISVVSGTNNYVFYKEAASAAETLTLTLNATGGAIAAVAVNAGPVVAGHTPQYASSTFSSVAAGYTQSPALTTANDNMLVLQCAMLDSGIFVVPFDANVIDLKAANSGTGFAYTYVSVAGKRAAGPLGQFNWGFNVTNKAGLVMTVAVRVSSADQLPAEFVDNRKPLVLWSYAYGPFATISKPDAFASITQIAGLAMDTTAVTNGASGAFAYASWGFRQAPTVATANKWVGGWLANINGTEDLTGAVVNLPHWPGALWDNSRAGANGIILVFKDSVHNWAAFQLDSLITAVVNSMHISSLPVDVLTPLASSVTEAGSSGVAIDWTDQTHTGFFYERKVANTGTTYLSAGNITYTKPTTPFIVTGKHMGQPINAEALHDLLHGFPAQEYGRGHPFTSYQGVGQLTVATSIQLGDGTTVTEAAFPAESICFKAYNERYSPIVEGVFEVVTEPTSTCSIDYRATVFASDTRQDFKIHASANTAGSILTSAQTVRGQDVLWKAGFPANNITFLECYTVDGKTEKLSDCTFTASQLTSGAYLRLDGGGSGTESGAVNSTFTKGAEDYAVELRTAGYYDFTDTTFSGYTNELYISAASGTVTITLAVGQTQPDVYNPNGCTIVWDVPTVDVTFGPLEAGSQVVVFEHGTTTEMFRTDTSGTSEVWASASGAYDYTIMKAGLLPVRGSGSSPTASITIDPRQSIDWAYPAGGSTTLVFADLAFDHVNKYLKCNVATTGQNLYAFLIESWIAEASLANKDFIMSPNGPNGFALVDGWETRGFTVAGTGISNTTLDNITRDGLRYLTGTTETAVWAAILTSGVPTGKQVRYQQSDGGTTINATNTGNMDQLVQTYGDATHGNFDYRGYMVLKVQAEGYDQAEVDAYALYGSLEAQLYSIGLALTANGVATGDPAVTLTLDRGTYADVTSGKTFSIRIVSADSGTNIMRELRYNFGVGGEYPAASGYDGFDWHDLVQQNGSDFKTVLGNIYGTAAVKGVVVYSTGTTLHPDFTLFTADDGTTYSPPVVADVTVTGMPNDAGATRTNMQIFNSTARSASAWAANTPYATGAIVKRTTGLGTESTAGLYFRATVGGTSDALEPTWVITTPGTSTTTDNDVTWTCYAILFYDGDPAAASYATTYIDGEEFLAGETAGIRFAEMVGGTSFVRYDALAVAAASGFSFDVAEEADTPFATIGFDGSAAEATYSPDYVNDRLLMDANIDFDGTEGYAYFCYLLTSSAGMWDFWGGVTALDEANFRIEVPVLDMYFNETAGFVKQTDNSRWFRSDGARPALDPTTGGEGIEINWRVPVNVVSTGGSALTPTESAQLMALPSASTVASAVATQSQSTPFHADARKMNGATITGTGISSDLWRGA